MEWPSRTSSLGRPSPVVPADAVAEGVGAVAMAAAWAVGTWSGLVVSLTGASLVGMMDNFTPNPFVDELNAAGVPEQFHDWLSAHGVGALVVKLGIRFTEMGAERMVATMPVE